MKIVIIEDEQSNADRLRQLIEINKDHEIVEVLTCNADANHFFVHGEQNFDLILSDIQLGDGLVFESLRSAPATTPIIFTTAYEHYAVKAFKFNCIDYLLKPVDQIELETAINKVEKQNNEITTVKTVLNLLASISNNSMNYRERFLIPFHSDQYIIVMVSEVSHIAIVQGLVRLFTTSGKSYVLNMTLDEIISQLDPQRFMRVNRQFIVNAAAVEKASNYFLGKMRIHMKAYPETQIIIGKNKVANTKKWLNF